MKKLLKTMLFMAFTILFFTGIVLAGLLTFNTVHQTLFSAYSVHELIKLAYSRMVIIILKSFCFWLPAIFIVSRSFNRNIHTMNKKNNLYHKEVA